MKARVKATGEIVDIIRNSAFDKDVFYDSNGQKYNREELSFDFKEKSFPKDKDYWTRLEHQYAGMAMNALLLTNNIRNGDLEGMRECNTNAMAIAYALIQELKEKEERK